jgi:putative sterol carrier protein
MLILRLFRSKALEKGDVKMGRVVDGYKEFVRLANEVAEAKNLMTGWDRTVQFIIEGEDNFYIKTEGGKASFNLGEHESPSVTLKGPEEVFYKMLTGELDQTRAYFAKQYSIQGSMGDAMKFGRLGPMVRKASK